MKFWQTEVCLFVFVCACGSAPSTDSRAEPVGGQAPVGSELTTSPAPGWLPGDLCDPQIDGWKPEPIPVSPEVQKQIDDGQPVFLSNPSGYQSHPPPGVAECVPWGGDASQGTLQTSCKSASDCPKGAVCPSGYDYCVTPCAGDGDCQPPNTCLSGRLDIAFCGCANEGCRKDPVDMRQ